MRYLRDPASSGWGSGPGSSGSVGRQVVGVDGELGQDPVEPGREPPVGLAEHHHDGGHDGHPDEDGVDQDAAGQADAELLDDAVRRPG